MSIHICFLDIAGQPISEAELESLPEIGQPIDLLKDEPKKFAAYRVARVALNGHRSAYDPCYNIWLMPSPCKPPT